MGAINTSNPYSNYPHLIKNYVTDADYTDELKKLDEDDITEIMNIEKKIYIRRKDKVCKDLFITLISCGTPLYVISNLIFSFVLKAEPANTGVSIANIFFTLTTGSLTALPCYKAYVYLREKKIRKNEEEKIFNNGVKNIEKKVENLRSKLLLTEQSDVKEKFELIVSSLEKAKSELKLTDAHSVKIV